MREKTLMKAVLLAVSFYASSLCAGGKLQGKRIFITGGSSGIGAAIVKSFSDEGADIVFTYNRQKQSAELLIKKLARKDQKISALPLDILDQSSVEKCLSHVKKAFPKLDVFVNNAAILSNKSFLKISIKEMQKVLQANVASSFVLSQALSQHMINNKVRGSIIHIGSFRGQKPVARLFAYSMSKAALDSMNTMMASELAAHGIRVNLLAPGGTLTAMSRQIYNTPEKVQIRGERVPLGRYGRPEDHIGAAVYLASDASSWTTGSTITIDGGESTSN